MFFMSLKGLDLQSYAQVLEKKVIFNTLLQILGWQEKKPFHLSHEERRLFRCKFRKAVWTIRECFTFWLRCNSDGTPLAL